MTITLSLPVIFGILWSALVVGLCVISLVAVELACGAIEQVKRNRHSAATSDHQRHVAHRALLFLQIAEIDQNSDAQTRVVAAADPLGFEHRIMQEAVVRLAVGLTGPL